MLACVALLASCAPAPKYVGPKRMGTLTLGQVVSGSRESWDWRTGPGGDIWTFVAPHTGSYRFHVTFTSDEHRSGIVVSIRSGSLVERWGTGAKDNEDASITLPLLPGSYELNVGENSVARGRYRLQVEEDTSAQAAVRAEETDVVESLCASAAPLRPGFERGVFQSLPGGARATCGGTGGGTVYRLQVERPTTLRIKAVAQFRFALELRSRCVGGEPLACVGSRDYEGALTATLVPGEYFVVLDSTEIGSLKSGLPGADVRGAFSIEREPELAP
jgi:hypothetical protein